MRRPVLAEDSVGPRATTVATRISIINKEQPSRCAHRTLRKTILMHDAENLIDIGACTNFTRMGRWFSPIRHVGFPKQPTFRVEWRAVLALALDLSLRQLVQASACLQNSLPPRGALLQVESNSKAHSCFPRHVSSMNDSTYLRWGWRIADQQPWSPFNLTSPQLVTTIFTSVFTMGGIARAVDRSSGRKLIIRTPLRRKR